jgi:hypothetical protein
MKISVRLIALVAVMGALGNVLGLLSFKLPSAPGTNVEFHLSVLPSLLIAMAIGPISGAITGALSTIIATMKIGNIFIPFGNALLVGVAGLLAKKLKFTPPVSGSIAMIPYAPYIWFASSLYGVPEPIIAFIIVKAFIEVLISSTLVEFIFIKPEIKNMFATFKNK